MMTKLKFSVCLTSLLGLAAFTTSAWTQDERSADRPPAERKAPGADPVRGEPQNSGPRPEGRGTEGARGNPAPDADRPPRLNSRDGKDEAVRKTPGRSPLAALAEALRDAKDEAERKSATETIRKHLDNQFEMDLAVREQELAAVEERVKMLRQQFDRRKMSKDEIITLRLKTILNNAEGLGFPGDEGPEDRAPGIRDDRVPAIRKVFRGDIPPGAERGQGGDRGAGAERVPTGDRAPGGEKERVRDKAPDGERVPNGDRAPGRNREPVPEGRPEPK